MMFDIPVGKAISPIENNGACEGCFFNRKKIACPMVDHLLCDSEDRLDGKSVIFDLVDYPEKKTL